MKRKGWVGEKERHKLASKGISTRQARYSVGREYTDEDSNTRSVRRRQIIKDVREFGKEDPDSLFYQPTYEEEFESQGKCRDTTGLADKHKVTEKDVDKQQLKIGIEIEMEHTNDPKVAKKIALDHLSEIPDYYTRLVRMEKDAEIHEKRVV